MNGPILGWDVGGANIKAAKVRDASQRESEILEVPFALWREPQRLPAMLGDVVNRLGSASAMAITMTAELADCFATKREGVAAVLDAFRIAFPDAETLEPVHPGIIWMGGLEPWRITMTALWQVNGCPQ